MLFNTSRDIIINMTTILLSFFLVAVFIAAIVSPHAAGKIQRKTNEKAGQLKIMSNWLWDPLTWWAKHSIEFNRKVIGKIVRWGSRIRR